MRVRDVMSREVRLTDPDDSILVAARTMREKNIGSLAVGRDGQLLGIITDRDLVIRCLADGLAAKTTRVRQIMSHHPRCCFDDQSAEEARTIMVENDIRRLPVLDRHQNLVGIFTLSDADGAVHRTLPWRVVFYRSLVNSTGQSSNVTVTTVYITDRDTLEDVERAAIAAFESDQDGRPWHELVDGYTVIDRARE